MEKTAAQRKVSRAWLYPVVFLAAALVYVNSIGGAFVFDDKPLILGDPGLRDLGNIPGFFSGEEGFHKSMGRYYRPLVSTTYAVDTALSSLISPPDPSRGMDPCPFHVTNVLVHAAASLLLFRFLLVLFRNRAACLAGALLFAVHPVHTEAVSWISGRTDSMAGLFYIAAFLVWVRYSDRPTGSRMGLLLLFYLLALLCKEMAVTFPIAAVLFDMTIGRESRAPLRSRLFGYAALFGLTVLFVLFREYALRHVIERETYHYFYGKGAITVAASMFQTVPVYARLLFVPVGLLYHYNGTMPFQETLLSGFALGGLVFTAAAGAAALFLMRKLPVIAFCALFFFLALLPVMNIVPTMSLMAERFLYIPSLLVAVLAAWALSAARREKTRRLFMAAAWVVVVLFSTLTVCRNRVWENNETLYFSAEGTSGTSINVNLGNHYARKGNLDKAETLLLEALSIREETINAHLNLGVLYTQSGVMNKGNERERFFEKAAQHLERALSLDPSSPDPLYALATLGHRRNRKEEAVRYLEELQKVRPGHLGSDKLLEKLKKGM